MSNRGQSSKDKFTAVLSVQFTPEQREQIRQVARDNSSFEAQVVRQAWNFFYDAVRRRRKRSGPSEEADDAAEPAGGV